MIQIVLFDFNGVIIDDEGLQLRAIEKAFAENEITMTEDDYYNRLGMDDISFARSIYEQRARDFTEADVDKIIRRKIELHRESIKDELPLFSGVETFIKALARRYTLGIVSMSRRSEIDHVLERAGLRNFFSGIISAEDVTRHKPDPDCFNQAFLLLDQVRREEGHQSASPSDCLVIEDSPPGIEAAIRAGMRTLGVTNTVDEAALRAAGAEVVTPNLADWTPDAVHHLFGEKY